MKNKSLSDKEYLDRQKQVFYVTQRIEGAKGFEKMTYGLAIDCLLDNKNSYITLMSLSNEIKAKNIMLSPERLHSTLMELNVGEIFENFPNEDNLNSPFKLKEKIYNNFTQHSDCIQQLRDYVDKFLEQNQKSPSYRDKLIEILLESVFFCNIKFLKHIVATKDETSLQMLLKKDEEINSEDNEPYCLFNLLLKTSDSNFDEILRCLILRMFDFLSLNFNPKYALRIEKTFGGKYYYLDSSFIIRLLGFDGLFRKERALELINILKEIKGLKFIVHEKTIEETKFRIKELIGKNSKLLERNPTIIKSIFKHDENGDRNNFILELFLELREKGKVRNSNDFAVYCENVKARLENLLPFVEFDSEKLPKKLSTKRECIIRDLEQNTDKSKNRIKLITSLLEYIDNKRGANNYDVSDIKYWLLTTDQKTLIYDNNTQENIEQEDSYSIRKSICIVPSELIRLLDGFSGEIRTNHVGVFKNYMIKSHVFPHQYEEDEIKTICKIATLVEQTNINEYNIDEMVESVLHDTSIKEIQKRLNRLSVQREKDKELIDLFLDRNEDLLGSRLSSMLKNENDKAEKEAIYRWNFITGIVWVIFVITMIASLLDYSKLFNDVNYSFIEYFDLNRWTLLDISVLLLGFISNKFLKWVDQIKNKYIQYYINKEIRQLK